MFAFECIILVVNAFSLCCIYCLGQLEFEKRNLKCAYYMSRFDYLLGVFLADFSALLLLGAITMAGGVTPTLIASTALTIVLSGFTFSEASRRDRLHDIEISLEALRVKYGIVMEPLYEKLVKHDLRRFSLTNMDANILTSEERKLKVIEDPVLKAKAEAFIKTYYIDFLDQVDRAKAVYDRLATLKTLCVTSK